MAPKKKKPTKVPSRKKFSAVIEKMIEIADSDNTATEIEPEAEPEPEPEHDVVHRQHKKFGKFRCLLENSKSESDESNLQQDPLKITDADKEADKVNIEENVGLPVVLLDAEGQMELTEMTNDEVELSEQLTQLNVIENYSVIAEGDGEIFIDNVESDITVECVSEEVVVEVDEPAPEEVEDESDDKNEEVEDDEDVLVESDEVVDTQKKPKKKQARLKKSLPKSVTSKAKAIKNQLVIEAQNSNSDASSASESSIRRSSRIKSINVLKQRTKVHNSIKKILDSDTSENSNSSHVDSEKATPVIDPQTTTAILSTATTDDSTKPVKVKSRWRRSSELEMSIATPVVSNKSSPQLIPDSPADANEKLRKEAAEEVAMRLKQFVHLKENQYLTERVSCKEAKKMTCDCFLTSEEIEKGENGCGDDCLNRLLMIEW